MATVRIGGKGKLEGLLSRLAEDAVRLAGIDAWLRLSLEARAFTLDSSADLSFPTIRSDIK
ncbi:hypothetical protein [Caballeronia humi]|uniref:hypothetical protein n=1 Tax=Caballeronia humi TaxID=326474 RepID=UPI000F74B3AF|nr:hypothetical protein [Caballeronia humi]